MIIANFRTRIMRMGNHTIFFNSNLRSQKVKVATDSQQPWGSETAGIVITHRVMEEIQSINVIEGGGE